VSGAARFPNGTELRAAAEWRASSGRRLEGYAATFFTEARIAGQFTEVLLPGCFASSLEGRDVLLCADHDTSRVMSRTRAGTLRLSENGRGLWFEADLPNTTVANDVLELVRSGNAGGMSFAFTVPEGGERWSGERRELRAVTLHELSVVSAWPAYQGTSVAARARQHASADKVRLRRLAEALS
jgi:HK97 family phage prohead protease